MAKRDRAPETRPGATRLRARELLMRALYQAETTGDPLPDTWRRLRDEERLPSETLHYADAMAEALAARLPELDAAVRRQLEHWSFERLGAIDRAVLRLAAAELLAMPATPARVVLDQAVELAQRYGGEESGPFVNGILDRLARELRPGELDEGPSRAGERRGA